MEIVLALGSAVAYGAADFMGGLVTRANHVITVVLLSQLVGTAGLLIVLPLLDHGGASTEAIAWGAASGVAGAIGVVLLYAGLAAGRMSLVAPVTAVEAASVPVLFGLIAGERPGAWALTGVALALTAVVLVSGVPQSGRGARRRSGSGRMSGGLPQALGAGLAFGAFFILLDRAGGASGMWPLVGARASSLSLISLAFLTQRPPLAPAPGTSAGIAASGFLDVVANLLYLLATQRGLLSLVAVLTSIYPAVTVLLARLVLDERMRRSQILGLTAAAAGVVLISAG